MPAFNRFAGCEDDAVEPLPETVPLIVESSAKSFVMGEELTLTLKVNDAKNPERVTNEDFDIYLTAKDGEKMYQRQPLKHFLQWLPSRRESVLLI